MTSEITTLGKKLRYLVFAWRRGYKSVVECISERLVTITLSQDASFHCSDRVSYGFDLLCSEYLVIILWDVAERACSWRL